jgi:hypothetical protein
MSEISETIRAAQADPTSERLEAMWRAVFGLPAWYFLPAETDGPTTPLVARIDDGDWVLAFTHVRPLNTFAAQRGLRSPDGELPLLPLSPREAYGKLEEVADHVDGLWFNPATEFSFRAPNAALEEFARRFLG